jgi:CPA1 family monovalent cation:H+ antiporter
MHDVSIFLGLLTVMTLMAWLSQQLGLPYPTMMVLTGLAIAAVPGLPHVELEPELVMLVFLPPLLMSAAWYTSWPEFVANRRPIGLLAVGLVLATTFGVACIARFVAPDMPWACAFALGAVVSPPDAIAATSITKRLGVPRRLVTILEGESLVNDATGLVAYRVAVVAAVTGAFSPWSALAQFFVAAGGGIVIGLAVGWLMTRITKRVCDPTLWTSVTLLLPYASYLPAEACGVSGVLATVATGLFLGHRAPIQVTPTLRLHAVAVWDVLVFILSGVTFVLIGLQLPGVVSGIRDESLQAVVLTSLAVSVAVIAIRLIWIFPSAYLPRLLNKRIRENDPLPPPSQLIVLGWAGMRGVVSLAAALALPLTTNSGQPFPYRDVIIFIVFVVILCTLVFQSLTLPWLIRFLGVNVDARRLLEHEVEVRLGTIQAALERLKLAESESRHTCDEVDHLRQHFEHQVRVTQLRLNADGSGTFRELDLCEDLYGEALKAQRHHLVALRNRGAIPDELLRQIEHELDLEHARLVAER